MSSKKSLLIFILVISFSSNALYHGIEQYKIKKICVDIKYNDYKKIFVFIGDSYLVVKARLDRVFSSRINSGRQKAAVLNLGESGIGPFDYYYKLWNAYKMIKKIDHIVIFLYLGNDILEVSNASLKYSFYIDLRFIMKQYFPGVTCVVRAFKNMVSNIIYAWRTDKGVTEEENKKLYKFLKVSPEIYNKVFIAGDDETKKALKRTKSLLFKMHELAKRNNSQILFVLIPPAFQIDERYFPIFEYDDKRLDKILAKTDKVQTEFRNFFEKNDIDYIDLLEPFRENRFRNRLYGLNDNDDHWDIDAITIAADILAEKYYGIIK